MKKPNLILTTILLCVFSNINGQILTPEKIQIGETTLLPVEADGPIKIVTNSNLNYGAIVIKNPLSDKCANYDCLNDQNMRFTIGIGGSARPYSLERNCAYIFTAQLGNSSNFEGLIIGHRLSKSPIIFAQNNNEVIRIDSSGNLGIGTNNPKTKLEVSDGDIYISDINKGIIMKSPNGSCWRGVLDDSGSLKFNQITCPEVEIIDKSIDLKSVKTVDIYPNPVNETLIINLKEYGDKDLFVSIYSMNGQLFFEKKLLKGSSNIDVSEMGKGTYIIKVTDAKGANLATKKIVKN